MANGYLADTFLQGGTNKRTDAYGGSIANRMRFPLELTEASISMFGADRVGVRVSPSGTWGAISDSDPQATFGAFAEALNAYGLAYPPGRWPMFRKVAGLQKHPAWMPLPGDSGVCFDVPPRR